ncbi:hypothetical protein DCE93_01280 [Agromyces badenianii]|uniref:Uncharacterized protein n=1 Tax=Agromyces badenianii TaxID=2080742 RepID=A0A2S0WT51_9MICO|nr:hypothetical protein DCE93_01280 [Agromyces badenianii]
MIGTVNGDWASLTVANAGLARHEVRTVFQLGGLGLIPDDVDWRNLPAEPGRALAAYEHKLLFLDGPSDPLRLRYVPFDHDSGLPWSWHREEVRFVSSRIGYLPRGFRDEFETAQKFAVLGGGESDHEDRRVDDRDVEALGRGYADVLFTCLPPFERPSATDLNDKDAPSQAEVHRAFLAVRPRLLLATGSAFGAKTLAYATGLRTCRLVAAILNTETLDLEFIDDRGTRVEAPDDVTDLATQTTGRWLLRTQSSQHVVDLDRGTWERIPGSGAHRYDAPNTGLLRTFEDCAVGKSAFITTRSTDLLVDYYWARTSLILSIDRLAHGEGVDDVR